MRIYHPRHSNHVRGIDDMGTLCVQVLTHGGNGCARDKNITSLKVADILIHAQYGRATDQRRRWGYGLIIHNVSGVIRHLNSLFPGQ